jgi:TonB family protein
MGRGPFVMQSQDWVRQQALQLVPEETVPGWRPLLLSVSTHCFVLVAILWLAGLRRSAPTIVFSGRPQIAQRIPAAAVSLPPRSQRSSLQIAEKNAKRLKKARTPQAESTVEGTGVEALRERASLETKALIQDFKFRTAYGFSAGPRYELAFQISGEIPTIPAEQFPAHFEQYVVVEVTITTEGQVADARIVAGAVDSKIQQTLLAAVREFKYRPATRGGTPIPSQCDLVIHIPT